VTTKKTKIIFAAAVVVIVLVAVVATSFSFSTSPAKIKICPFWCLENLAYFGLISIGKIDRKGTVTPFSLDTFLINHYSFTKIITMSENSADGS
jgi:hypothetical protein